MVFGDELMLYLFCFTYFVFFNDLFLFSVTFSFKAGARFDDPCNMASREFYFYNYAAGIYILPINCQPLCWFMFYITNKSSPVSSLTTSFLCDVCFSPEKVTIVK